MREAKIKKYHEALILLHDILNVTNIISMREFTMKYKLNNSLGVVLRKGGIIQSNNGTGNVKYEWNTIKPNRQMAIKAIEEIQKLGREERDLRAARSLKKQVVKPTKKRGGKRENSGRKPKSIENRYLESYTIRLLFGLIKINIKLNYK